MTTITTTTTTHTTPTTGVRVGLALSALIGLANLPMLAPGIDWGDETPPYGLLMLAAAIGLVSVVSVLTLVAASVLLLPALLIGSRPPR